MEGYVEHIIFRNTENGYTVFELVSGEEEMTCTGVFGYLNEEGKRVRRLWRRKEQCPFARKV